MKIICFLLSILTFSAMSLELERAPFMISRVAPSSYKTSDFRTIHYTKVYRWAPKKKSDLESARKTFRKSMLPNNSFISNDSIYPLWFIEELKTYNKSAKKKKYLRGQVLKLGSTKFYTKQKYKVRSNNRYKYISEKEQLEYAKHYLEKENGKFFFDPLDFDLDREHILKFDDSSKLFIDANGEKLDLAGAQVEFHKNGNLYEYDLICDVPHAEYRKKITQKCESSFQELYSKRVGTIDELLGFIQDESLLRSHSLTCRDCQLYPKMRIKIGNSNLDISSAEIRKESGYISPNELYKDLFGVDEEFSTLAEYFKSEDDFQILSSKYKKQVIPMINYPSDIYSSYQYSEDQNFAEKGSRSTTNPFSACMFRKAQRRHLSNILNNTYRPMEYQRKKNFYTCMKGMYPDLNTSRIEDVISKLSDSNHPCSKYILTTGLSFQYGDISSSSTFGTFGGHKTHSGGKCIDMRPFRENRISKNVLRSKIKYQVYEVKNHLILNEINAMIFEKLMASDFVIEDKVYADYQKETLSEDGIRLYMMKDFLEFSKYNQRAIIEDYLEKSLELHDRGETNYILEDYFKYSLRAIDGTYKVKDESSTSEFIKLLKNLGVQKDSIIYIYGNSKSKHNWKVSKLGYESTIPGSGHIDHIHFCFDHEEAKKELEEFENKNFSEAPSYLQDYKECLSGLN